MNKKDWPSIVPFLDLVDFYLQNEPDRGFSPAWKAFHRAALESMGILCKMLGQEGVLRDPGCIDTPRWSIRANACLEHKVPVDELKKEAKTK